MYTRKELLNSKKELYLSRARGAMIGLAVGDAVGDIGRDQDFRNRYGMIVSLYPEAKSTDDTEFGFLTARTLLDCDGDLTPEVVWDSWKRNIVDRGGMKKRGGRPLYGAVRNIGRGIKAPWSGIDNTMNDDDGAAMRMAPIGIFAAGDEAEAGRLAEIDACVSHDRDGIWAARAVAAAIAVAIAGAEPAEAVEAARRQIPDDSWLGRSMDRALALCRNAASMLDIWEVLHTDFWASEHASSAEAIPQALAIFYMTGKEMRESLFWAANFGRDADTIAAVVCALSGATHGVEVFPSGWVEQVRKADGVCLGFVEDEDALDLARRIVDLAVRKGSGK
jgi:ADP-ribosylglycohydrolase